MKVVFYANASNRLGLGHFYRCANLARLFGEKGIEVVFISTSISKHLRALLFPIITKVFSTHSELVLWSKKNAFEAMIIDLNKEKSFKDICEYNSHIKKLTALGFKTIAYDVFDSTPLDIDLYLLPYPEIEKHIDRNQDTKYLTGLRYFQFPPKFYQLSKIELSRSVDKILIFMGGTDPYGLTLKFLNLLNQFDHGASEIVVITGYNSDLTEEDCNKNCRNATLHFIKGSDNVQNYIVEADLGIVNSGLVKYECAFLGLPLITVSNEFSHEEIMLNFEKVTGAKHLGLHENVTLENLKTLYYSFDKEERHSFLTKTQGIFSTDKFYLIDTLINFIHE